MNNKQERIVGDEQWFARDRRRFRLVAGTLFSLVVVLCFSVLAFKAWTWEGGKEIPTLVGPATVTECIHHSDISWMGIPGEGVPSFTFQDESWELWLRIGEQADSIRVNQATCRTPPGSLFQVRYRHLPRTGRLMILGIVPPSS